MLPVTSSYGDAAESASAGELGRLASIRMSCDLVVSVLPTLSEAEYLTVAVAGTLKGPV